MSRCIYLFYYYYYCYNYYYYYYYYCYCYYYYYYFIMDAYFALFLMNHLSDKPNHYPMTIKTRVRTLIRVLRCFVCTTSAPLKFKHNNGGYRWLHALSPMKYLHSSDNYSLKASSSSAYKQNNSIHNDDGCDNGENGDQAIWITSDFFLLHEFISKSW